MKKILVVVDVQNDFITGSLKNEEAQKKVPNIVKKIREFDGDYILVTRDTHEENYLETKEGEKLPVVHCVKGTEGWNLEPNVAAALRDTELKDNGVEVVYFDKPTFGSYKLANDIEHLIDPYDNDIEIIGFVSSICVISNALLLKASYYEKANIIVDTSCIAGLSEENNKAAIEVMKSCQIEIK